MSLPASVPPGLGVASFRAGLARGVAAARPVLRLWPGRTAPGEYRSPFPARLRAARAALVVLALIWLAAGFAGLNGTAGIVRTVGHDTAPSVSAAEGIRTGLSAANADYALAMLALEGPDGAFVSAMRLHLRSVRTAIVEAASNITYGDEERGPITTLLQGLGEYEQIVGQSIVSAGTASHDFAFAADDLLHWTMLPAAVTLERVNAGHLDEDYEAYLARRPVWWFVGTGLLLLGCLAVAQVDIARTARRVLNPGLLAATLAVLASTTAVTLQLWGAQSDLRVAKADAFDSIYALSTARALASDAEAAQSFYLFALDDARRAKAYDAIFEARAAQILRGGYSVVGESTVLDAPPAEQRRSGYLGEELANVTFPGEATAAREAIKAWEAVRASDVTFHLGVIHDLAGAQRSVSVDRPGSARQAFARFDAALDKVLAINRTAFASAIAAAEGDDAPLGAVLVAGFVLSVAAAWFGIGRRLDEYRF